MTEQAGVGDTGFGLGVAAGDYDNDGDLDLYVNNYGPNCLYRNNGDTDIYLANDVYANFLFDNDGTGRFTERGLLAGLAYDMHGDDQGSMGIDCADYDNDGRLDFYQTSYAREMTVLYRNLDGKLFEDVTTVTGAGAGTLPYVTWGAGMIDFDNDGDRDIFVATGHLQDNIELYDNTTTSLTPNLLLMNSGNGTFRDISTQSGDGMQVRQRSRGAGFDDLDNDGDVDVVILNARQGPTLLRNDSPSDHHWIQIRLRGTKTNRDGVGARVSTVAGDLMQIDEVHSGRGYQSHYGMRLHFGLGKHTLVDRIEVRWIGGGITVFEKIVADQLIVLSEDGS